MAQPCAGHEVLSSTSSNETQSFAQQYDELASLLSKVKDKQSALTHINDIQDQLDFLAHNQSSGEVEFNLMSPHEQELFVKRFQNNRFHCGAVTQVMQERQRILLDPELAGLLKELLMDMP